jgi:hypothetical protein
MIKVCIYLNSDNELCTVLVKGTLSRDFLLLVFFTNPVHRVALIHGDFFAIGLNCAKIFEYKILTYLVSGVIDRNGFIVHHIFSTNIIFFNSKEQFV